MELLPIACQRVNLIVSLERVAVDPHALQWMQASVSCHLTLPLMTSPAQECVHVVSSASREETESLLEFLVANLADGSQALKVACSLLQTLLLASE